MAEPVSLAALAPGDRFVVSTDLSGHTTAVRHDLDWDRDAIGPHSFDVTCEVVARHELEGHSREARVGLRSDRSLLANGAPRMGDMLALPADEPDRVALSRARFRDEQAIDAFFRGRRGRWLVVRVLSRSYRPRRLDLDPFTDRVPLADSFTVCAHQRLVALCAGPTLWAEQWALCFLPSGYYTPIVCERIERFETAPGEPPPRMESASSTLGSLHLYRRTPEGDLLWGIFPDRDTARAAVAGPGPWLLAVARAHVFIH